MGITRLTWRIRRLCRHWTPLVYLLLGILVIQAFVTFHSGPNLVEEEERLRLRRLARIDQHNELAQSMLKGEKSLLANKLNGGGPEGGNAHDPKFRERFVHGAKSDVYIIEDHDQPMAMEKDTGRLKSPGIDEPNIDANRAVIEAPYAPRCEVEHKDAVSAISRATTSRCKQEIADTACKAQNGTLFPATMPRFCPHDYKYSGQAPIPQQYEKDLPQIKICFMLVVHGRAVRQFKRLLKVLYHSDHYFYIHVDKRSNHLHREILKIASQYPNVKVAKWRMATIWGGSSLLQMLMRAMNDVLSFWKDWNFFINLSALDFPIETNDKLVNFLATYNTKNFMKSHGRDDEKFIRKQGLNRIFVECDQHMWRLGERELPGGITLNGGSDWIALNRDFCDYVINGNDALLTSLKHWYQYTLLPAESFFHTLAQNSLKCETFVDNNLRVTNWNRARGCKCQYKHIVDWCGCSPNDFYPSDLFRLQTARPVFFARKFEESINQEVVNHLDFKLYGEYPRNTPALYSYWENVFDHLDETLPNDALLTHYHSFGRMGLAKISPATNDDASDNECLLRPIKLETVEMYRHQEEFKGYIVTLNAKWMREDERLPLSGSVDSVKLQAWISLKPQLNILDKSSVLASRLQWAAVGTNWDVKELVLRDWGGIVGTLSEPRLVAKWSQSKEDFIVTVVLIDPLNVVADYNDFKTPAKSAGVTDTPLSLKKPLRPGKWKVRFYAQRQFQKVAAELTFIVSPLQFKSGAIGDVSLATDNRGVVSDDELNSATRNLYSIRTTLNLRRDYGAEESMEERATYIGEDLESWVDEVIGESWQANDVCVASADPTAWTAALARDISCDKRKKFSPMLCKNAQWSTLSPDPKSELTHIKPNGRIR